MPIMEILKFPHPALRRRAEEITRIDDRVRALAKSMIETMHRAPGIGLAAPQVGVSERLIVVDLTAGEEPNQAIVLVNPEIITSEGEIEFEEGCLSIPDLNEKVTRAEKVTVRGFDLEGREVEIEGDELMAIALQHEIDHLEGVLFLDHISRLKRSRYIAKRKKDLAAEREE